MVAYEKALNWQCLFDLAIKTEMTDEDTEATAYRIAGELIAPMFYAD
jgi:elongator complex protein 1